MASLSLSDQGRSKATNGHAEPDQGAAAAPAATEPPSTADASAQASSTDPNSAAAGPPLTQDALIQVHTFLTFALSGAALLL